MKIKTLAWLAWLSVLIAPTGGWAAKGPQKISSVLVVSELVGVHPVSQSLTLVGKLKAQQSVEISSEVTGIVERILVSADQRVIKDQPMVQLNDDKAQASYMEASAYLKDEQRKLTEYERLALRGAITPTEIDAQRSSVVIATARLNAAKAGKIEKVCNCSNGRAMVL